MEECIAMWKLISSLFITTQEPNDVKGHADSSDSEDEKERFMTTIIKADDKQMLFDSVRNGDLAIVKDIIGRHSEWKKYVLSPGIN